jgi:hypothetical protein
VTVIAAPDHRGALAQKKSRVEAKYGLLALEMRLIQGAWRDANLLWLPIPRTPRRRRRLRFERRYSRLIFRREIQ